MAQGLRGFAICNLLFYFRGTEQHLGIDGSVDIINSTLGKALGGAAGGYTAGPKQLIDLLRNRSRPYLFSNTLPPPVVACANKVDSRKYIRSCLVRSPLIPNFAVFLLS